MFRRIPALGAAAALFFASVTAHAACTPTIAEADLVTPGKLQLSINPTNPPQQFVDKDGKLQGLNVELADALSKKLCLDVELVRMDFPAMIPAMNVGRIDGMNTGMFWTAERSKLMYMIPYGVQAVSIVTKADATDVPTSPEALAGKATAVEVNTYQENWLKKQNEALKAAGKDQIQVRTFPTATSVAGALLAGQVDNAAFVDSVARDLVKRQPVKEVLPNQGAARTAMAFRNKNAADAVVKALNELREDGTYGKLYEKFGLTPLPADESIKIDGPGPA